MQGCNQYPFIPESWRPAPAEGHTALAFKITGKHGELAPGLGTQPWSPALAGQAPGESLKPSGAPVLCQPGVPWDTEPGGNMRSEV